MAMENKISCTECTTKDHSLFCSISGSDMDRISNAKIHQHFKAGQYLLYAGNQVAGIYCLLRGNVKVEMDDDAGHTQMMEVLGAGGLLGYRALFSDEPLFCSAVALDDVEACFIPKQAVLDLVSESPSVALTFLAHLSKEHKQMAERLQHATTYTAAERIAEALLMLRERFREKAWTRKDIAEWAGTTPETVIRTLGDFESQGIVELKGRQIKIVDRPKLLAMARIHI
jgi:CRP-like cAMP-binding protein